MRGLAASLSVLKRPLTGPSVGFPRCRVALSPHAGRGKLQSAPGRICKPGKLWHPFSNERRFLWGIRRQPNRPNAG
jgi:hypothetical protein